MACNKNLHDIRNSFVALILIIHAGIIAALQTEYINIIHDKCPPDNASNTVLTSSPVDAIYFCFLKYYVISKLKPVPTNTLLFARLASYFFFIYFLNA